MIKKLLITITAAILFTGITHSQNTINHKGQELFLAGINIAWMDFGNDLTQFNESEFTTIMKNVSDAGGNSVRWWIHIDGRSTPTYTNDTVSGITPEALDNLSLALDIAAENGIVVSLCLWSFDMMAKQKDGEDLAVAEDRLKKNKILLEDSAATQAYINNALIPMVNKVKGHTAILCWEIFNEPEGMNIASWSHVEKVNISYIQQFVNRCSGAIHRTDPEAKVSNGSWNALATVDISAISSNNYYSDSNLIAAGGDSDGVLDFYMFHYYAEWYGSTHSPFHHPASYWELDKPLIIGEFAAKGIIKDGGTFLPKTELTTTEALDYLYTNGYAGGWGWTYTGHDGNGSLADMEFVLDSLRTAQPEKIIVQRDVNHNYAPFKKGQITDTVLFKNSSSVQSYLNLNNYFGDERTLQYQGISNGAAVASIINDSIIDINVIPDSVGFAYFSVTATDDGSKSTSLNFYITVKDSIINSDNKLLYALTNSSSIENTINLRYYATDGDMNTRWSSAYNDSEWIQFDMLEAQDISRLVLYWELAYANSYKILVSNDNATWNKVFEISTGQKTKNNIVFPTTNARYIRIEFTDRASAYGYSLYEVEAFTDNGESQNITPVASTRTANTTSLVGIPYEYLFPRNRFIDDNDDVLQFSAKLKNGDDLPTWLTFDENTLIFSGTSSGQDTGTFVITVTAKDWFNEFAEFDVTLTVREDVTSITETNVNSFKIYPNPITNNTCVILYEPTIENEANISITNMLGTLVFKTNLSLDSENTTIELPTITAGMYIITIETNTKKESQIIIIE